MQKRNIAHDFYQPDEPIVVSECDYCGAEIYDGEICYELPKIYHPVCKDCINEVLVNEFENLDFSERLDMMCGRIYTATDD